MADPFQTTTQTVHLATHSPEFAKQVIFTDDIIEFIRHYLLNEVIDETGKKWVRKTLTNEFKVEVESDPMMKEEYVYQLTNMLRPTVTRLLILTKLERDEVNNMILITANDLDVWFAMNWKKAGMQKEIYFSDLISDSLINMIEAIAKMSQEGSIQKFFGETYRTTESLATQQQPLKPAIQLPSSFTTQLLGGGKK
jgi:hypothetical protein